MREEAKSGRQYAHRGARRVKRTSDRPPHRIRRLGPEWLELRTLLSSCWPTNDGGLGTDGTDQAPADTCGYEPSGSYTPPSDPVWHDSGTLAVLKSADVATVAHSGTVTYAFFVSYTPGPDWSPAQNITISDFHCPVITGPDTGVAVDPDNNADALLEAGETWRFDCTLTVPAMHTAGEQDPIVNMAEVNGQNLDGLALMPAFSNAVSVEIVHAAGTLAVDKTAPAEAAHGDTLTYSYGVTYTPGADGAPAQNIQISDDKCMPVVYGSGDTDGNNLLDAGEVWLYSCSAAMPPTHTDGEDPTVVNLAVVTGQDLDFDSLAPAMDMAMVSLRHTAGTLAIDKTGPATALHGDTVTYGYAVTYAPGSDGSPAKDVVVSDDLCWPVSYMGGDTNSDNRLDAGETWTYSCTTSVPAGHVAGESDPIGNTATVTGNDIDGDPLAPATDSVSVDIPHDAGTLAIDKSAPATAPHGSTITYTYLVTYTPGSDGTPAQNVVVTDDVCSPVTFVGGDMNGDYRLDAGETWSYSCTLAVPPSHSDGETNPIVNTATVAGEDVDGDPVAGATDWASTQILHDAGSLAIVKSVDIATVNHGDEVLYTFQVNYTPGADGSAAQNVVVSDPQCDVGTLSGPSGDDGDGLLEAGETWTFTCKFTVPIMHTSGEEDPIVNVASVAGTDLDGDLLASALSNPVSIDLLHEEDLCVDPTKTPLIVTGTPDDDVIVFGSAGRLVGHVKLTVNGVVQGTFSGFDEIIVFGLEGDDSVNLGLTTVPGCLFGGPGDDILTGGKGPDTFVPGPGDDRLDGRTGHDSVIYTFAPQGVRVTLGGGPATADGRDRLKSIEIVYGSAFDDVLTGDKFDNTLFGGGGNDLIRAMAGRRDSVDGGTGNDTIDGGAGNDTLLGGLGDDHILKSDGNDLVLGGPGADHLDGGADRDTLDGGSGNDTIEGGPGNDTLTGGLGDDSLSGEEGNDTIDGGDGHDTLRGGTGTDLADGGPGNDLLRGDFGDDTLFGSDGSDTLEGGYGDDTLFGGNDGDALRGEAGRDSIFGGDGSDTVDAGDGNDRVFGESGNDSLAGGQDNDSIQGGDGADTIAGDSGKDTLDGGADADLISGGHDNDTLLGGYGDDTLSGDGKEDRLDGGAGNDVLLGGIDYDTLIGGEGSDSLYGEAGNDRLDAGIDLDPDLLVGGPGLDAFLNVLGADVTVQ
jgi:Ca2+-binding RTX toxin-like protein